MKLGRRARRAARAHAVVHESVGTDVQCGRCSKCRERDDAFAPFGPLTRPEQRTSNFKLRTSNFGFGPDIWKRCTEITGISVSGRHPHALSGFQFERSKFEVRSPTVSRLRADSNCSRSVIGAADRAVAGAEQQAMAALAEPAAQHALVARAAGDVDQRQVASRAAVGARVGFDVGVEPVGQLDRDRAVFGRRPSSPPTSPRRGGSAARPSRRPIARAATRGVPVRRRLPSPVRASTRPATSSS